MACTCTRRRPQEERNSVDLKVLRTQAVCKIDCALTIQRTWARIGRSATLASSGLMSPKVCSTLLSQSGKKPGTGFGRLFGSIELALSCSRRDVPARPFLAIPSTLGLLNRERVRVRSCACMLSHDALINGAVQCESKGAMEARVAVNLQEGTTEGVKNARAQSPAAPSSRSRSTRPKGAMRLFGLGTWKAAYPAGFPPLHPSLLFSFF